VAVLGLVLAALARAGAHPASPTDPSTVDSPD
jgi:hypothetical protein